MPPSGEHFAASDHTFDRRRIAAPRYVIYPGGGTDVLVGATEVLIGVGVGAGVDVGGVLTSICTTDEGPVFSFGPMDVDREPVAAIITPTPRTSIAT